MLRRPDTLTFDEQAKLQQVGALPAAGCRRQEINHTRCASRFSRRQLSTSTAEVLAGVPWTLVKELAALPLWSPGSGDVRRRGAHSRSTEETDRCAEEELQ